MFLVPQHNVTVYIHLEIRILFRLIVPMWVAEKHRLSSNSSSRVSISIFTEIRHFAISVRIYNSSNSKFFLACFCVHLVAVTFDFIIKNLE